MPPRRMTCREKGAEAKPRRSGRRARQAAGARTWRGTITRTVTEWALPGLECPCCAAVTFAWSCCRRRMPAASDGAALMARLSGLSRQPGL